MDEVGKEIGSSPRVRGTRWLTYSELDRVRFIPACAGNTRSRRRRTAARPVHPRVCGEHIKRGFYGLAETGSSPRVRGTRGTFEEHEMAARFIPACAGNTPTAPHRTTATAVHPRVCGEHYRTLTRAGSRSGSSPRVRGTRRRYGSHEANCRFIPACAGNTTPSHIRRRLFPVHPRVCGEHIGLGSSPQTPSGSSPRVRGTHHIDGNKQNFSRFIPACAGNTLERTMRSPISPGSSPRVRGTHLELALLDQLRRFIPACAGNTSTHRF